MFTKDNEGQPRVSPAALLNLNFPKKYASLLDPATPRLHPHCTLSDFINIDLVDEKKKNRVATLPAYQHCNNSQIITSCTSGAVAISK